MFESLSDRFDGIFHKLRSRGKLTDKDIDEVARELRVALLEADVNVRVARDFINRVKERAQGAEVAKSGRLAFIGCAYSKDRHQV